MLKKYIVLFESKDYGWITYSTTESEAKRTPLSKNNKYSVFYILEKQYPYTIKLRAPLIKINIKK